MAENNIEAASGTGKSGMCAGPHTGPTFYFPFSHLRLRHLVLIRLRS